MDFVVPPPTLPDPFSLACPSGSHHCESVPDNFNFFNPPNQCYNGNCAYIKYPNIPWAQGSGQLVAMPRCEIPLGAKNIPIHKLRVQLLFFSGAVDQIIVRTIVVLL